MQTSTLTAGRADQRQRDRIIAAWLLTCCAMVFAMVVLGGVTRLTHSGLSMVEWKPVTGWLPPLSHAEWMEAFEKYRQFPEYQKLNKGMSLGEFQSIFWFEFLHRLWGRTIGVFFLVPAVFFLARGWVRSDLAPKLMLMFVLGGLQGVLGWYMVKSGLVDEPDVSQYRLTAHLGAALVIYAYMLWVALGLLYPRGQSRFAWSVGGLRRFSRIIAAWAFVTILSGGFVAGLDAGLTYNTFPLMDGDFIPEGVLMLDPVWINPFENIITVQFDHRILAEALLVLGLAFWWRARQAGVEGRTARVINGLALALVVQVALGITTLLLVVPVTLGALHQAGAVVVLTMALWSAHELRAVR